MNLKKLASTFLSFLLTVSIFTISIPQIGLARAPAKSASASDIDKRLSSIEAKLVKRQKELGIPGISLAIVKDNKVIYSKGLGYKDFENKVPITANTQLAIGSATKAFTGLSVLMLQDQGKLSLDDSPKKYLPYFKMNNPETDKNITVRDLMAHSSGLNRTDLAMITGKLDRVELIKVAGIAKPMAGLRKKFFYQNIMFAAAGEVVANVEKQPWEEFVPQKIFAPLGMNNSTMTVTQMQKAEDYSFGYNYNFDTKETSKLPTRDITHIGPAGSINSSANDMAKWLKFVLNGGELDGKKLVSKAGFDEWTKPQMKISSNGSVSYGLGWFVQSWKNKKVIQHGGNIDGFNSMVALMPEENLGFVMLSNVTASSLGNELMNIVWSEILEDAKTTTLSAQAKKEVGLYNLPQAGFDIEVKIEDGKLVAKVPNQPTYILENVKDRKYKLSNAPAGFFLTFKDTEAFLEQPQGNATLKKRGAAKPRENSTTAKSANELIGFYEAKGSKENTLEIKNVNGKASLVVGNQPPYPLEKRDDGNFGSPKLPPTYAVKPKKKGGKLSGIILLQPNGSFEYKFLGKEKPKSNINMTIDDLMAKTIQALGGETNMRKINSRMMEIKLDAVHQGVKGYGKIYQAMPNKTASKTTITALGKKIGWVNDYFDGTKGGEEYSFSQNEEYTGKRLEDAKVEKNFYTFLDWKSKYEKVEIVKMDKVGNEEAYVVSIKPKNASKFSVYVSTKTFLPLQKKSVVVSSTSSQRTPITEKYSDYKEVDGLMLPFKITSVNPGMGDIVTYVTKIKHNVKISKKKFQK